MKAIVHPAKPNMPHAARLVIITCLVAACAPAHPERLAEDVDRYLGAMQTWAQVEIETDQGIQRLLATHFVDDGEVLREVTDGRPRIRRHLHDLRAYHPATPDIQAVHRQYIHAWSALLRGYSTLEQGIKEADPSLIAGGREALLDWRRALRTVAADLGDLAALTRSTR